ncbi:MAG: hypothetical protein A2Y15_09635 [Clostridiales bacterium GWF2_36_10]|nr:MAG: hypothetical protein A2Y15_09635 [Clostridiales bacterium GWF2_36_10]HAN21550.1 dockerin type 1 [Clostridiales bacterium]
MKIKIIITLTLAIVFILTSCSKITYNNSNDETLSGTSNVSNTNESNFDVDISVDDIVETSNDIIKDGVQDGSIVLSDNGITAGDGVLVDGKVATIKDAGVYTISGAMSDGQIVVYVDKEESVELILNGVNLTCLTNTAIYGVSSDKIIITIADGTENTISDGSSYTEINDDDSNAAIYSKDDITIKGKGKLIVFGNYNNGISSTNDIKIIGGMITVNSKNTALRGKDSVKIGEGCNLTINSGGDAIKSSNDTEEGKGVIIITGGVITVTSGEDGIEAVNEITITSGDLNLTTDSGKTLTESTGYKGIKCDSSIIIAGGTFNITSNDDAINCGGDLEILGGVITISADDDGIHSDSTVKISGGKTTIAKSYEGLEGNEVEISGGEIRITSSDDGINTAGGTDTMGNDRPGKGGFSQGGNSNLTISGGLIAINAAGDGIDINGTVNMSSGTLLICGPTDNGNGPLDYNGDFKMTGGFLIAAGSSGMAQGIGTNSSQYGLLAGFDPQSANTIFRVEDSDCNDVVTFAPCKQYSSVAICSPSLKKGETYTILFGGRSTGALSDWLYTGGSYSGGTEYTTITVSSILTTSGNVGDKGGKR